MQHLRARPSLVPLLINPFSPMLMCDWHHVGEPDTFEGDGTWSGIAKNVLNATTVYAVKPCDSVCVDVTSFEDFVATILPRVQTKVLLFTHRWCMPPLVQSSSTDAVKSHANIWHWFAQNPLYVEDERYSAFPYGMEPKSLQSFGDAFLAYHDQASPPPKNTTLEHLHLSASHASRHRLISRATEKGRGRMRGRDFYNKIGGSRFLISPRGDREDCYRHWEAIGLGAIPVANINATLYGPLFGQDMVYVGDTDKMLELLDNPGELDAQYHAPRSELVLTQVWSRKVRAERQRCLQSVGGV